MSVDKKLFGPSLSSDDTETFNGPRNCELIEILEPLKARPEECLVPLTTTEPQGFGASRKNPLPPQSR